LPDYRLETAYFITTSTLDALCLVDNMGFLALSGYAADGAVTRTHGAAHAFLRRYFVMNQRLALVGRTFLVHYMGNIFFTEPTQGA